MDRPYFLGIDTSNYTTSAAKYDARSSTVCHSRKILPVGKGELGLRQSDALFHHIRQLPEVLERLMEGEGERPAAVCVSDRPRSLPDSYMPCFLAGKTVGQAVAQTMGLPFYTTSHQNGHIAAALWSAGRMELLDRPFLAFHVSGGTFEALRVAPSREEVFAPAIQAKTLDISAGQLIDRVGQMLDLGFPAGPQVEQLALRGRWGKKQTPAFRGRDCCLSGMENKARQLLEGGTSPEDLCRFVLEHIAAVLCRMAEEALAESPGLPLVFSGGVMSNSILRQELEGRFACSFASPEFSADNAAGTAIIGSILHHRGREGTEWQQASRSSPSPSSAGM
mgnify:FL=1